MARSPKCSIQATALVVGVSALSAQVSAEPRFGMSSYHIGSGATSVDVIDLNGDGVLDIVAPANRGSQFTPLSGGKEGAGSSFANLSVFLGRGDGLFDRVANNPPAMGPGAVGDLTGDGVPDLLAIAEDGALALFRGIGNGRFQDPQSLAPNVRITRPVIVDLDNDGANEAVFGIEGGPQARIVILKQAIGGLIDVSKIADSNPFVHYLFDFLGEGIALGDVNNDGFTDIAAIASAQNAVQVFLNDGAGSFLPATTYPIAAEAPAKWNAITVGDADNDGFVDIAILAPGPQIGVLAGDGVGGFAALDLNPLPSSSTFHEIPAAIRIADVHGTGGNEIIFLDVLFSAYQQTKSGVTPTGKFLGGAIRIVSLNAENSFDVLDSGYAGMSPRGFALADVNGDARTDAVIVAASLSEFGPGLAGDFGQLNVYLGAGSRPFATPVWLSTGSTHRAAQAADVNNDGLDDVLIYQEFSNLALAQVVENTGDHSSEIPFDNHNAQILISSQENNFAFGRGAAGLQYADFSGDEVDDLLVFKKNLYEARFLFALGEGDGVFNTTIDSNSNQLVVSSVGDLTGDGKPEIVQAFAISDVITVSEINKSGAGVGLSSFPLPALEFPALRIADVTGDGDQDVIVMKNGAIVVLEGDGEGGLQVWTELPIGGHRTLVCADFDADGDIDILIGGWAVPQDALTMHVNLGNGQFMPEIILPGVGVTVDDLEAIDINGDGRLDIAILSANDHLKIAYQNAAGVFDRVEAISVGNSAFALDAADVNGDGAVDLIVLGGETRVNLSGQTEYSFNAPFLIQSPTPTGFAFGDLTGNGLVDGADLAALLSAWGMCGDCLADLNNDGAVNGADLAMLLANWS